MTGGSRARAKGDRLERAIVNLLQSHGLGAERVPLSGAAGGRFGGDLSCPCLGRDLVLEAKSRRTGFSFLYKALVDRDVLVLRSDRCDALVVLRLKLAAQIAAAAEGHK
jgi:Holliday junction resolvase